MADVHIAPVAATQTPSPEWEKRRTLRRRSSPAGSVKNLIALTRSAEHGMAKTEASRLIGKIASAASTPAGKLRAELIPDSTWKRARKTLGPQASQTTARLNHVFAFAQRIWGNERDAAEWLAAPHLELAGATPYSMLRTESGGRAVEALLGALEFGFPV
jgi:putative toxin-antitoxin system antitoxin component (TIGR02293 family)